MSTATVASPSDITAGSSRIRSGARSGRFAGIGTPDAFTKSAISVIVANLIADLLYGYLDPRVEAG